MPDPASDAATLVAMNVADMSASLEGIDLATLQLALDAEAAKGDAARKGALAALQSAIDGHPELSVSAAVAADAPIEAVPDATSRELKIQIGLQALNPVITEATEGAPATAAVTVQPTVDGKPFGDPITVIASADDPELPGSVDTAAKPTTAVDNLEDAAPNPDALSNAPARPHQTIVDQLEMRWFELVDFVRHIEGEAEGDIGDFLTFIRSKL